MIVGLGNPGKRYSETRHNVGYKVVQNLALKLNLEFTKKSDNYLFAKGKNSSTDFTLLLPITYMNLSGIAVKNFYSNHNFDFKEMLVVCDDINLPVGKLRLRTKGSHGGHNGLFSIINEIQSTEFPRLRIGIGNNFEKGKQVEYVLSEFDVDELNLINDAIEKATIICNQFLEGGVKEALEYFSKINKLNQNQKNDGD